jgi:hypothetical protein
MQSTNKIFALIIDVHAVEYTAEALCHKPETRGFNSRRLQWILPIELILSGAL